jgi:arylsulfatase
MSDPLIVHWPKGIAARGEVRSQYVHVVDVTPTILEALGLQPPPVLNHVPQRPLEGVSFAHTFADAQAPTNKRVQYYEMIASRAIWADGWKAVVEQPQGEMLSDEVLSQQKWELYHVAEDFSETRDLAAEHPEKLARLVEQWWAEAGKYNVLPLDSRMQLRMGERKPGSRAPARRHVFEPGGAPQFEYTAVNLKNRSHTITAQVHLPPEGAQGVLFAHGSWFSGYSLYVKDDRLVYVHNYLGIEEYRIVATEPVPRGECLLAFVFTRTGEHRGHGRLLVNGREVGAGEIPRTIPAVIETSGEGQCCGYDSGLPVTTDYEAPFRFTGRLHQVVVEVEPAPGEPDAEAQVRAAFTDH